MAFHDCWFQTDLFFSLIDFDWVIGFESASLPGLSMLQIPDQQLQMHLLYDISPDKLGRLGGCHEWWNRTGFETATGRRAKNMTNIKFMSNSRQIHAVLSANRIRTRCHPSVAAAPLEGAQAHNILRAPSSHDVAVSVSSPNGSDQASMTRGLSPSCAK